MKVLIRNQDIEGFWVVNNNMSAWSHNGNASQQVFLLANQIIDIKFLYIWLSLLQRLSYFYTQSS